MRTLHRSLAVALPAAAALTFGIAPAQADVGVYCNNYHDNCGIFYFNSNLAGSRTAFTGTSGQNGSISDLAPYKFLSSGNGQGQGVKNNAASFFNSSPTITTVFYHSNFGGACDTFAADTTANRLVNTYNENASLGFGRSGTNCYKFL